MKSLLIEGLTNMFWAMVLSAAALLAVGFLLGRYL